MGQIIALEAPTETAGAITYWSLSGNVSWAGIREALAIEGVPETYWPMGVTSAEALARAARACCRDNRQLIRPLSRGAWGFVQEQVTGEGKRVEHVHILRGWVEKREVALPDRTHEAFIELADGVERTEATDQLRDEILAEYEKQRQLISAMDTSTWLVQVAKQLHAVSLRDRGGVYFMPRDVLVQWRRITRVLTEETKHKVFEIPAMKTEEAVDAILTAVRDTVQAKFAELEGYLAAGVSTKGLNSWERQMAETRAYIDHYVQLLGAALPDLTERLENFTGALTAARLTVATKEKAA